MKEPFECVDCGEKAVKTTTITQKGNPRARCQACGTFYCTCSECCSENANMPGWPWETESYNDLPPHLVRERQIHLWRREGNKFKKGIELEKSELLTLAKKILRKGCGGEMPRKLARAVRSSRLQEW